MKLKNGEVRIYYKTKVGEIDSVLDLLFTNFMESHGFRLCGAGFNMLTDVRDLSFDKKIK